MGYMGHTTQGDHQHGITSLIVIKLVIAQICSLQIEAFRTDFSDFSSILREIRHGINPGICHDSLTSKRVVLQLRAPSAREGSISKHGRAFHFSVARIPGLWMVMLDFHAIFRALYLSRFSKGVRDVLFPREGEATRPT